MNEWTKGTAKRECAIDAMVEVEMMQGSATKSGVARADQVAWRDVERWRLAPDAPADDWIKWSGGACPVDHDVLVQIKLRDGALGATGPAKAYRWDHFPPISRTDIVAYRMAEPRKTTFEEYQATAVAEHDRLTAIIAAKDAANAELVERNAALAGTDTQLAHVQEQLENAEAQLTALTGSDRAALRACEAERDKLARECRDLREFARQSNDDALQLATLMHEMNEAIFDGRISTTWRDQ